jgi:hypothetical protein
MAPLISQTNQPPPTTNYRRDTNGSNRIRISAAGSARRDGDRRGPGISKRGGSGKERTSARSGRTGPYLDDRRGAIEGATFFALAICIILANK